MISKMHQTSFYRKSTLPESVRSRVENFLSLVPCLTIRMFVFRKLDQVVLGYILCILNNYNLHCWVMQLEFDGSMKQYFQLKILITNHFTNLIHNNWLSIIMNPRLASLFHSNRPMEARDTVLNSLPADYHVKKYFILNTVVHFIYKNIVLSLGAEHDLSMFEFTVYIDSSY